MRLFHDHRIEGADVALLFGFSLGLGIAVHEVFFLVAAGIGAAALTAAAVHAVRAHTAVHHHR